MRAIVVGAKGRMGAHVLNALESAGIECVAKVDGFYDETKNNEYKTLSEVNVEADVLIDFSFHLLIKDICEYVAKTGIATVIATTGHTAEEKQMIYDLASKAPVFYSGNYSLGITMLCDAVKRVVSAFPDADVEIVETHHNRKADAPSGTAKMLFDAVKEVRPDAVEVDGRNGMCKRPKNEVGVNAIRVGNIVGIHEVIIGTDFEQITLKHEAYDRAMFAQGAVKAANYLVGKANGLYSMKDLLCDK